MRLFRRYGCHHHGYQARAEAGHRVERRVIKGRGGKRREERRGEEEKHVERHDVKSQQKCESQRRMFY